jgi:hypothetical protein
MLVHIRFSLPSLDFCQRRSEVSFICSHKISREFVIKRPYLPKYRPSNKSYVANNVEWSHMDSSDTEYSNLEWVSRNLNSKLPAGFHKNTAIQSSRRHKVRSRCCMEQTPTRNKSFRHPIRQTDSRILTRSPISTIRNAIWTQISGCWLKSVWRI